MEGIAFLEGPHPVIGLFASSPNEFRNFLRESCDAHRLRNGELGPKDNLVRVWDSKTPKSPITITNKGIRITSHEWDLRRSWASGLHHPFT
jgi:hypothetical protein